jgi:signal transduction histidine kinase
MAVLVHDTALVEERDVVEAVVAVARLALANERLQAEVRAQLEEVRASRVRMVEAADAERRRVERNLHDGAQQRLVSLSLTLRLLQRRAAAIDEDLAADVTMAADELRCAIEELRELARGIHPTILAEQGLGPALEALAEQAPVPVNVAGIPSRRLPQTLEATAYFLVAEALANVAKHAGASQVMVVADLTEDHLVVEVLDDGRGGATEDAGTGLRGLRDRVAAIGGTLSLHSPPAAGTCLRAELPCA